MKREIKNSVIYENTSYDTLAQKVGVSKSCVYKYIKNLKEAGLIHESKLDGHLHLVKKKKAYNMFFGRIPMRFSIKRCKTAREIEKVVKANLVMLNLRQQRFMFNVRWVVETSTGKSRTIPQDDQKEKAKFISVTPSTIRNCSKYMRLRSGERNGEHNSELILSVNSISRNLGISVSSSHRLIKWMEKKRFFETVQSIKYVSEGLMYPREFEAFKEANKDRYYFRGKYRTSEGRYRIFQKRPRFVKMCDIYESVSTDSDEEFNRGVKSCIKIAKNTCYTIRAEVNKAFNPENGDLSLVRRFGGIDHLADVCS